MRRAALRSTGARGARAAKPQGGALRPDPAASGRAPWGGRGPGPAHRRRLPAPRRARTQGQSQGRDPQAASPELDWVPDIFAVRVLLEETGERFLVTKCRGDMTVRELKVELELIAGIPLNLQRLQYLDQGDLMDDTTLKFHDVVPGGIISLCVWRYDGWIDLVLAAVEEDTSKLSCLGVTEDSPYQTAHVQHLGAQQWGRWTAQRAFVALYVASHRGHADAVRFLLEHGASCHGQTPMGRTPLHAAVAMNQLDCINLLLQFGASTNAKDALGVSPKAIARKLNYKQAKQRMALSHWMAKSGRKSPVDVKLNKALQRGKPRSGSKNKT